MRINNFDKTISNAKVAPPIKRSYHMKRYTHLTLNEREKLFMLRKKCLSFAAIAELMGRSASSLSREYKRNKSANVELGYLPDRANILAKERKAKHGCKLDRHPKLKSFIIEKMQHDRYSPEMIHGVLKLQKSAVRISTETIYQYVYSTEGQELKLYQHLMRARPKRNQKYGRRTRSNHGIPGRVSISHRPKIKRREFGHFEADLTFFKGSSKINLLTIVERKTSYLMAELNDSKCSKNIAHKLLTNLIKIPKNKRMTITFDNGKEFVMHDKIKQITGIPTYFCHPGAPWEKPYVEYTHALLHRFIPKKTDANTITQEQVKDAVNKLNNLPRKRLGFKTPAQMMANENFYQLGALRA
jgi:transposase, IS30 family